ncbi:MAG: hypothetical protein MUC59_04945 [Saprospiraceae bacterium]|nr:hypothetical protein [Saprospiraceae bacterium]
MSKTCEHKNPLQRDGSSQQGRSLPALDPASVQLDDRSAEDLVHYASQLAAELNFHELDGSVAGDWRNFLQGIANLPAADWAKTADREPQLALFLTFLKLYQHSQKHLNDLPRQHLEFFYKNALRLRQKPEQPDQAHVVFELNKRIAEQKIEKSTRLLAGKDAAGKPLYYDTDDEIILNRARVAHLRSVFNEGGQLRTALFADTADGWGEAFEAPGTKWPAFGHAGLPKADTGLALASHMLLLTEGERWVTLSFKLSGASDPMANWNEQDFLQNLDIQASGEKGWLGPFTVRSRTSDNLPVLRRIENGYELKFRFQIPAGEKPVVGYQETVLKERFNTASPLVKIVFRHAAKQSLEGLRLDKVKIAVEVLGMKNLALENDFGTLDPAKPFQPFGPQPKRGSSFYVGSEEVFTKKYTDLKLHVKWQDLPAAGFPERYKHYPDPSQYHVFKAGVTVRGDGKWNPQQGEVTLFPPLGQEAQAWAIPQPAANQPFMAHSQVLAKSVLFQQRGFRPVLFSKTQASERLLAPLSLQLRTPFRFPVLQAFLVQKKFLNEALKEGFMKLTLHQHFGHEAFVRETIAVSGHNANPDNVDRPYPSLPYTPQAEYISLSYTAETGYEPLVSKPLDAEATRAEAERDFLGREIQFFHLEPFGHREQHGYIKQHLPFLPSSEVTLLPSYPHAGEFYIGLENAEPLRTVNLLFQLAEGSADPELPTQKLAWSVLSQNHWRPLTKEHLLADHTNHFLQSGIVRINLPREASAENTLLDGKLIWLRATVPSHVQAVCQVLGIHAQAVRATWVNIGNDGQHLATALPPFTIKKMASELGTVKKIEQPYASFGGRLTEQPAQFYVRASERLRHKNRAVAIWDYEHLVLEQFPAVYKAKCLNHTGPESEFSPGNVTMVLVPQLRNQNAVDPLQPRFSAAVLREVEAYLAKLSAKFVRVTADNADFEEVQLAAKVKFRQGFEAGFYAAQLSRDLVRHLTPWAFEGGQELQFGGRVHLSQVVAFVEQLPYVDYLDNFSLHRVLPSGLSEGLHEVAASNSKAILVSAKSHLIQVINN